MEKEIEVWDNELQNPTFQYSITPVIQLSEEGKMAKRSFLLIGLGVMFLVSTGCVTGRVEMDYGTSYKLAKFNQTLNPQAEKNLEPVTGEDGKTAEATIDRYRRGFQEKPAAPTYTINVSGMGTGGQ